MITDNPYKYLTYTKVKYSFEALTNKSFPIHIQNILAIIGLPEADINDALFFEPCSDFEQIEVGENVYYRLGKLSLSVLYGDVYIDKQNWNIWILEGRERFFLNTSLSSFLLFIDVYVHSILVGLSKEQNSLLSIETYKQLKAHYEVIDLIALEAWGEVLEEIKNFYR